jgi:ribonuclease P protein component
MIPSNRKVGTRLFKDIINKGKSFHSENFSMRVLFFGIEKTKLSVVISKKVEKSAVKRNFMKRRFYAVIKEYLPEIKNGFAIGFFLKKKIDIVLMSKLNDELGVVFKKAGIIVSAENTPSALRRGVNPQREKTI